MADVTKQQVRQLLADLEEAQAACNVANTTLSHLVNSARDAASELKKSQQSFPTVRLSAVIAALQDWSK